MPTERTPLLSASPLVPPESGRGPDDEENLIRTDTITTTTETDPQLSGQSVEADPDKSGLSRGQWLWRAFLFLAALVIGVIFVKGWIEAGSDVHVNTSSVAISVCSH
jgi:hypothetical protein